MYSDIAPKPKVVTDHSYPVCTTCGVCLMCVEQFEAKHNEEKHNAAKNEAEKRKDD